MKPFFLLFFVLLLPIVAAFDCSSFGAECVEVQNSDLTSEEKRLYYSSLLQSTALPDHETVTEYNEEFEIEVASVEQSKYIKDAWLAFGIYPAVYEKGTLYVPSSIEARSEYDYRVETPPNYHYRYELEQSNGDCIRTYRTSHSENHRYLLNGHDIDLGAVESGELVSQLTISAQIRIDHYQWVEYSSYNSVWYECEFSHTSYEQDQVVVEKAKDISMHENEPAAQAYITDEYYDTTHGYYEAENYSFFRLDFTDSYLTEQQTRYDVVFEDGFAYLQAHDVEKSTHRNLIRNDNEFYVENVDECQITLVDHFTVEQEECELQEAASVIEQTSIPKQDLRLMPLIYIVVFLLISYIFYKLIHTQAKKIIIPIILMILLVPTALADNHEPPQEEECSLLTNFSECLSETLYDTILVIINAPLAPTLFTIRELLTAEVHIDLFKSLWSMVRYVLGFFYVFFFLYAGYVFLFTNSDPIKRAHAKEMLKNTIIMIVLIQASFYLYGLLVDISTNMSSYFYDQLDPRVLMITVDNVANVALEIVYGFFYLLTLSFTAFMLIIRYVVAAFGVVIAPVAIFCYYIPPLKSLGKFLLQMLGIFIFVTVFDMLLLWGASILLEIELFAMIKILLMTAIFIIINYTLYFAIRFAMKGSSNVSMKDDLQQAVKYVALLV